MRSFKEFLALGVLQLVFSATVFASSNSIYIRLFTAPDWCSGCEIQEAILPPTQPIQVSVGQGKCINVSFQINSLSYNNPDGSENAERRNNAQLLDAVTPDSNAECGGHHSRTIPCNQLMIGNRFIAERGGFTSPRQARIWIQRNVSNLNLDSFVVNCN